MAGNPSQVTVIQQAIAVLRRFGTNAHVYLPGVGMLNGLQAGNYLDSAGTTQGTVDQPVGLVLDAAGSLGVELVTNGGFDSSFSGWTDASVAPATAGFLAGAAVVTSTGATYGAFRQTLTTVVGTSYRVLFTTSNHAGNLEFRVGTTVGGTQTLSASVLAAQSGEKQFIFTATGTSTHVQFYIGSAGGSVTVDTISVREVTGIAASQTTAGNRPILRRGAVNLLTYSGDFSNAAWVKGVNATLSYSTDSQGTVTRVQMPTGSGTFVYQTYTAAAAPYTVAVLVRKHTGSPSFVGRIGAATTVVQIDDTNSTLFTATDDWSLVVRNFTGTAVPWNMLLDSVDGATALDIDVRSIGLFQGTLTATQIQALGGIPLTTTAPASTALGPYWWQFDGSNDSLALGGPIGGTSEFAFVMAFRLNSLTTQVLFDEGTNGFRAYVTATGGVDFNKNGVSAFAIAPSGTVVAGEWVVISCRQSGGVGVIRKNGVQIISSANVISASGLSAVVLGASNPAASFFVNGSIGLGLPIKGTVTDPDLLLLEKFVGQMSGVQI